MRGNGRHGRLPPKLCIFCFLQEYFGGEPPVIAYLIYTISK
jgi:hypothetical protein